jgi:hypothetical protein
MAHWVPLALVAQALEPLEQDELPRLALLEVVETLLLVETPLS